jgi:4-oxalocrotonate tautomerase
MPFVEIKVFEGELSKAQTKEVIKKITDVMVSFSGEVKSGAWGVGGKALGLDDIRAIQAGKPKS